MAKANRPNSETTTSTTTGYESELRKMADALRGSMDAARERPRQLPRLVRRILRKHGYPPDRQEKATQTVLEQAEVLSAEWVA